MEITVISDQHTAQELQATINPGNTIRGIVLGGNQPNEYVVIVENEIQAALAVGILRHIGVLTKYQEVLHYPNDENDGSLEIQPCTCGAEEKEDCRCNDGYLHIEIDPIGRTHIWPGTENWVHHPEWDRKDK